jgi:hypothetical protein
MEDRKPIASQRAPGASFDVFEPTDGVEEVYVDGFHTIAAGPGVAKLVLYSVSGLSESDEGPVESRTLKLRLAMPATALYQLAFDVVRLLAKKPDEIRSSQAGQAKQVEAFLADAGKLSPTRE